MQPRGLGGYRQPGAIAAPRRWVAAPDRRARTQAALKWCAVLWRRPLD